jgi:hypothetical protein
VLRAVFLLAVAVLFSLVTVAAASLTSETKTFAYTPDFTYDAWRFGSAYLELLRSLRKDGVTVPDANIYINEFIAELGLDPTLIERRLFERL